MSSAVRKADFVQGGLVFSLARLRDGVLQCCPQPLAADVDDTQIEVDHHTHRDLKLIFLTPRGILDDIDELESSKGN